MLNINLSLSLHLFHRGNQGEYSDIEQEELFEWIKKNTPEHAVFAGKMSLMANLMLSTGRPIVNNPYYESKEMRYIKLAYSLGS